VRHTREYEALVIDRTPEALGALMHPKFLSVVRYEPIFRERLGFATLDLLFEDRADALLITGVVVDPVSAGTLEARICIWPRRLPATREAANAIEEHVFPWLRTLVRGRIAPSEQLRFYRPSALFSAAREAGFFGAAPYAQTLVSAAPFVFARRFAEGADVLIHSAAGHLAGAIIGPVARSIHIVSPLGVTASDLDIARRWYGDPPDRTAIGAPTVAIVDDLDDPLSADIDYVVSTSPSAQACQIVVPEPIAADHLFTFDPADAPEASRFSIRAIDNVRRPIRSVVSPVVTGGSGGTICFVLREDSGYAPDADSDAALELARRLRAEGFKVERAGPEADLSLLNADLIHIFGAVGEAHVVKAANSALTAGCPYIISLEPLANPDARYREEGLFSALQLGADLSDRNTYIDAYFRGKLQIDGIAIPNPAELARNDRAFGAACASAAAVLLSATDDIAAFCSRFPEVSVDHVRLAGVLVAAEPAEDAIAEHIPSKPFMFFHAPLIRRSNFQFVLAALDDAPYPVVVAGEISDVDLGITLRRLSSRGTVFLPDPTIGQIAALYRRAKLYVDASHRPTSLNRVIRAAQAGALPIVAHWSPIAHVIGRENVFDGTDFASASADLCAFMQRDDCSERAARLAALLAPLAEPYGAFTDVVGAYAQAADPVL
jgi:hypothetical protein